MDNDNEDILRVAREHGWTVQDQRIEHTVIERVGPMIDRSDHKRLTLLFDRKDALVNAYFGPTERLTEFPNPQDHDALLARVLIHLRTGWRS